MSHDVQDITASELIDSLSEDFDVDKEKAREVSLERIQKNQMPIYLRTLIGIGSFIAAGFLIAIVGITLEIDSDSMFGVGLVHVICAIPLYLKARRIEQHTPLRGFSNVFLVCTYSLWKNNVCFWVCGGL